MLHEQVRPEQARHDERPARRSSRFEVLISSNGSAALNGERLSVTDGQEVHVAVLDAVHRAAQDRGEHVDVTILDLRENGYATHIRVFPDGSSRLLVHGGETPPAPTPQSAPPRAQESAPPPRSEAPAPEPPQPAPKPPQPAPKPLVPGELAEAVAHINRAAAGHEPQRAMVLAFRLREHAVRSYGEEHPYTLEARDLEAYVARLGGNYASATAIYLDLARICHRQGNPRAYGYLKRAVGNWQMLTDPQSLRTHGQALLDTWSALAAEAGPAADDATLPRHVQLRLAVLTSGTGS
ncbi:hypothetical protein ACTWQF_05880 [Streptomyces sp. 8N114]|uniref:hypothetical protein n=1 Tax=Streptomyces sp. 8N114 TaxID=3457419 RepID=UPI003FD02D36